MGNKHPGYDDDFYDWFIDQGGDINMARAMADRMQDAWRASKALKRESTQPDECFEKWWLRSGLSKFKETALAGWEGAMATKRESSVAGNPTAWQPIETVPKDGTQILLGAYVNEDWTCMDDHWYQDRVMGGFDEWNEIYGVKPSHWMPIPQPPEDNTRRGSDE